MNANLRNVLLVASVTTGIALYNHYSDPKNRTEPEEEITHETLIMPDTTALTETSTDTGKYAESLANCKALLKLHEESGNQSGAANMLWKIGNLYADQGNDEEALAYYIKAVKINEGLEDKSALADLYFNIALVYRDLQKTEQGIEYFNLARTLYEENGD